MGHYNTTETGEVISSSSRLPSPSKVFPPKNHYFVSYTTCIMLVVEKIVQPYFVCVCVCVCVCAIEIWLGVWGVGGREETKHSHVKLGAQPNGNCIYSILHLN